jgi:hypothetical protein
MLLSSLLVICPLLTVPANAFSFISSWGTTNRLGLPMIDRNRNTCSVNVGGKSIQGLNVDGGCRYTVRYGDAKRWESSQVASSIGYVLHSKLRLIAAPNSTHYRLPVRRRGENIRMDIPNQRIACLLRSTPHSMSPRTPTYQSLLGKSVPPDHNHH